MIPRVILPILLIFAVVVSASYDEPPTVDSVDLDRYIGTWLEIARLEYQGEKGCHCPQSTYTKR